MSDHLVSWYLHLLFLSRMPGKPTRLARCSMIAVKSQWENWKQALVAVMNKLLKQVYAVASNGTIYQPNYCSKKS